MTKPTQAPALRVVGGGEPTDEELAALVVAISALSSSPPARHTSAPPAWTRRAQLLRRPLPRGGDAWRRSLRP